jgi:hypothetical protein
MFMELLRLSRSTVLADVNDSYAVLWFCTSDGTKKKLPSVRVTLVQLADLRAEAAALSEYDRRSTH